VKSIDPFLDRVETPGYNCLDFTREAWAYLFGNDSAIRIEKLCKAAHQGDIPVSAWGEFETLSKPVSPCFVVWKRKKVCPHVGIYIDGRVLHLTPIGAEFQVFDVVQLCLNRKARFYR
jgi:hypothetical protein